MAAFNNGTGGSISGITSLEDWTVALINFLRIQQGDSSKNPNSLKHLTISTNTDGAISGNFTCPITVGGGPAGIVTISASSYLVGVTYTAPTGGDSTASNEVQALIDSVRKQKNLELDSTKNPNNANYLSFSVTMGTTGSGTNNGTINLGFSGLPCDMTQSVNGSLNTEGRTYLN